MRITQYLNVWLASKDCGVQKFNLESALLYLLLTWF